MTPEQLQALIAKARANAASAAEKLAADKLHEASTKVQHVDMSAAGLTEAVLATPEGQEVAQEFVSGVIEQEALRRTTTTTTTTNTYANASTPVSTYDSYDINRYMSWLDEGGKYPAWQLPEIYDTPRPKKHGVERDITLNEKQSLAVETGMAGDDLVIVGAAGTGKTTIQRTFTRRLVDSGRIPLLSTSTKWLHSGKPGVVILSYTNKAVNNIRHAVVEELKLHTITMHKLLEYKPEFYEIEDPAAPGSYKKTMRFEPSRNATNPLPSELCVYIYEESSMIPVELYALLQDASPQPHQEVFIGDIQQLPPVFGQAILGFKMDELPVIELTEVYRQAADSPILDLAWAILKGNPHDFLATRETYLATDPNTGKQVKRTRVPSLERFNRKTDNGEVIFQTWQSVLSEDIALISATKLFCRWSDDGYYNPEDDIILCPFNKAFGTVELNKGIAQHLAVKRDATVYEIVAGFEKHYLAVGDRVLYDKEDCIITSITRNGTYSGKLPSPASKSLDRWGVMRSAATSDEVLKHNIESGEIDLDAFLDQDITSIEDRVTAASHIVQVESRYGGDIYTLEAASDYNGGKLLGGYAITVHKFQGSENDKVFIVLHNSHVKMCQRELLYTAVTRAKKRLHIICEYNTFLKGVSNPRIKGNTLTEKAQWFKGKLDEKGLNLVELQQQVKKSGGSPMRPLSGKLAIKVADLVPNDIRQLVEANLATAWQLACNEWPALESKQPPTIAYDMRRRSTLGLAYSRRNLIKLNPIWLAAIPLDTTGQLKEEMAWTTLVHELCHIINPLVNPGGKGHDWNWKQCMVKMGLPPSRLYEGSALPPWLATKNELLKQVFEQYYQATGDVEDQTDASNEEVEE